MGSAIFTIKDIGKTYPAYSAVGQIPPFYKENVNLLKGVTYTWQTVGQNDDTWAAIYKEGKYIIHDDDSGGDRNFRLIYTPKETGTYELIIGFYHSSHTSKTVVFKFSSKDIAIINDNNTLKIYNNTTKIWDHL